MKPDDDDRKKRHERFLLDRFFEHQGIVPTCVDPGESPDFLIDLDGRTVGVEVTELFIRSDKSEMRPKPEGGPLLQAAESVADLIVSKAWEIYFDADNPPVLSTIWFSDRVALDKKNGDRIAELIARQIQSMSLQNSHAAAWRSSEDENDEHPLSGSVDIIHTSRVPERLALWTVARPGLVANLTPKRLQEEIDKKASKITAYKNRAAEIWLLIVVDRTRSSQKFCAAPDFPLNSISSPFAKTFYYDLIHGEVLSFDTCGGDR
jgi:hypothetical protein